jgi:hypothetical protein
MIEFTIGRQEYKVKEPTIQDYYTVQHLLAQQSVDAKIEVVAHLSSCLPKLLKALDKYQFIQLWNALVTGPLDLSEAAPFHRSFLHNGQLYGFLEMDSITLGEFADMDVLKHSPDSQQQLHTMMAILYRPAIMVTESWMVVDPYDSDALAQRAEEFKELPLKYVYGALNFFLQVSKYLFEGTLNSLTQGLPKTEMEKELQELANQIMLSSLEIGIGHASSALETISPKLERLKELALLVSSTTLHTESKSEEKKKSFIDRIISKIK